MSTIPLNIVGGANFGRYGKISCENTYNMFVTDKTLVPFMGYKKVKILEGNESRGIFYSATKNVLLHVIDDRVYVVDINLNYQLVGNLDSFNGLVYITENNAQPANQFAISDLTNIYIYTYGSDFQKITSAQGLPDNFVPGYIDFQDGYFICGDRNSSAWNLSHVNEGLNWFPLDPNDGLSYQGAFETKPDTVQATIAFQRILLVMANNGTEIWTDVGNTLFPYQRNNYISIDYGCLSIGSIAEGFGYVVWIGKNETSSPVLMYTQGGMPQQISTDGINFLMDNLQFPQDCTGFLFQDAAHIFYQVTWYNDNYSIVYDFTNGLFYTVTNPNLNFHIAKKLVHFNNKDYFIAYESPDAVSVGLYQASSSFTTYDNESVPRIRICPPIRLPQAQQFRIKRVSLTMEQGASSQLEQVSLTMSKNGGLAFGNWITNRCNDTGYGPNKMQFWQLGCANDVTFKFAFESGDPIPLDRPMDVGNSNERFVIVDGEAEIYQ